MTIRFRQGLDIEGTHYAAGEIADLPPQIALACVRRGSAELVERERLKQPQQNRIRQSQQNRGA
jgi:hypothetical protein